MKTRQSSVYKVTVNNNKVIYIGKTDRLNYHQRWKEHIKAASRLCKFSKRELIMALYFDQLQFELVQSNMSRTKCDLLETVLIKQLQCDGNTLKK